MHQVAKHVTDSYSKVKKKKRPKCDIWWQFYGPGCSAQRWKATLAWPSCCLAI